MKRNPADRRRAAEAKLHGPGVADLVAEGLMLHGHCCVAREAALGLIDAAGLEPAQFLLNWMGGAYDA